MFSGQTIYSSFQLSTLYLFTCPIFASFGFFYTDLKKETLMSRPEIYKRSRGSYLSFLLTARRQNVQWKTYVDLSLWELCERPSVLVRSIMVMQSTQSISGGGFSLFVSRVGHPIELWGMGFSLWTDIILSIIVMGAVMVPKWNWNFVTFFFLALLFFVSSVQWSYF